MCNLNSVEMHADDVVMWTSHPSRIGCKQVCCSSMWAVSTILRQEWDNLFHKSSWRLWEGLGHYSNAFFNTQEAFMWCSNFISRLFLSIYLLSTRYMLSKLLIYWTGAVPIYFNICTHLFYPVINAGCAHLLSSKFLFFTAFSRSGTAVS